MNNRKVKAHIFLDNKIVYQGTLYAIPRLGDTVRFNAETFGIVTEVIWCLDEDYERVNIRTSSEHKEQA